jgi:uncharacterized membrane protein (DUF106 family)
MNKNTDFSSCSKEKLEKLRDYYFEKHKEVREASKPNNDKQLDEKLKEYMDTLREIDKELLKKENR